MNGQTKDGCMDGTNKQNMDGWMDEQTMIDGMNEQTKDSLNE